MLHFKRRENNLATFSDLRKPQAVFCKLFSDTVTIKICDLRKQELNGRGGFSCHGCRADNNNANATAAL